MLNPTEKEKEANEGEETRETNWNTGFKLVEEAAEQGSLEAMVTVGVPFHTNN